MAEKIRINESSLARAGGVSIEVRGETLEIELDEETIGEGPARALRDAIAAGIRAIAEQAAPATIARRLARRPPSASTTLFNDTGRLGAGVTAEPNGDEWAIAAPPDRLGPELGTDPGVVSALLERLRELVPALRDPLSVPAVRDAIERSVGALIRRR